MKKKTRIALIAADFHKTIAEEMVMEAKKIISALNGRLAAEIHVCGAYEIPLAAKRVLANPMIDALVVLGWIEGGETLHGEVMGFVVHKTLMELQLTHDKPVGFGIIGPGATEDQARVRAKPVARRAVEAICDINVCDYDDDN